MRLRFRCKAARTDPAPEYPPRFAVVDIRVSSDGFPLTGRRYTGYISEVRRRQETGESQEEVIVWQFRTGEGYTSGTPRLNETGELEVLDSGGRIQGTVREMDGNLYFFPS